MGAQAAAWLNSEEVSPLKVTPATRPPSMRTVAWQ